MVAIFAKMTGRITFPRGLCLD